jgi:ABC-2 type transport system permease protein
MRFPMRLPDAAAPRPGSLLWLVLHELRLTLRSGRGRKGLIIRMVLVLIYACLGVTAGLALRGSALEAAPDLLRIVTAGIVTILSFMAAQVVIGAQRTLYESGDLDLLLSSPIPEKRVLEAKLIGLAGSSATTFAFLLLPLAIPLALIAWPQLLAIVPMLAALALVGASFGLGLAILLVRLIGPRGARATGQVMAALLGAMVFLLSQLATHSDEMPGGGRMGGLVAWMRETGIGAEGWSSWPARAALGEALPLILVLAFAAALFAGTSLWFRRHFLASYQQAGERNLRRGRVRGAGSARRLFAGGLMRAILRKELKLMLRQPELIFMMVLRLIYLLPVIFIGIRPGGMPPAFIPSVIAAIGTVATGQLTGSLAWMTISAEDAPDLLAVSPVPLRRLRRMKLIAALIMVSPVALVFVAMIVPLKSSAALVALTGAMAAGYGAGMVEMLFGKTRTRSAFMKRQEGSFLVSIGGLLVSMLVGTITAALAYFV